MPHASAMQHFPSAQQQSRMPAMQLCQPHSHSMTSQKTHSSQVPFVPAKPYNDFSSGNDDAYSLYAPQCGWALSCSGAADSQESSDFVQQAEMLMSEVRTLSMKLSAVLHQDVIAIASDC